MDDNARICTTGNGDDVTVVGAGSLDFTNSQEFHDSLRQASLTAGSVNVDLGGAEFIDTQVVQDLATAAVTLLKRDKRLSVTVREEAYPLRVLRISGFEQIMDIRVEPGQAS